LRSWPSFALVLVATMALAILPPGGVAQGREAHPPDVKPVFSSGLEVVNVTITVRDAQGRLVHDLTANDFQIYEDGRVQKAVVFGSAVSPGEEETFAIDLGLLLDTSESMLKELRLSQEAATRFLENIPRARDLITVFFDQDIRISRYNSENQQGLVQRIMEMKGSGNTALYDAITVYLSRVQDSRGRRILVLLTDGEDTTSAISLGELIQLVKASQVTIYSIAFAGVAGPGVNHFTPGHAILAQLAALSGGAVYAPNQSKDLTIVYGAILDELRNQYVLGYVSDNAKADGRFRKLRVEVRQKGLRVRHRQGYIVPKG
jgi:Ca-activated chloride channel homolog